MVLNLKWKIDGLARETRGEKRVAGLVWSLTGSNNGPSMSIDGRVEIPPTTYASLSKAIAMKLVWDQVDRTAKETLITNALTNPPPSPAEDVRPPPWAD